MLIRIIETGAEESLCIVDKNGIDWTSDLLGNNDALHLNSETDEHEMSQEDFDWWEEYIDNHQSDAEEITELAEELGIEESEIYDRINEEITTDLNDEHDIKQSVIKEFRQ